MQPSHQQDALGYAEFSPSVHPCQLVEKLPHERPQKV